MADYRIRIYVDPSGAVAGSQRATRSIEGIGRAVDNVRDKSVPGLMDKLRGLGGAIQIAAAVTALGAYMRLSDGIATANAQLKLATATQAQLNRAQRDAYSIAQRQGVQYEAMATLLSKTTKSATAMGHEMGRAQEIGRNATAAIAAGIRVSGTNAGAAAAGVFQLSQALASGTLRGDELNSVMENIPAVGDAIARAMGRSAGELRRMGAEGELTSAAITEALEKARPELERMAAMIPLTFGAAFMKVRNAAGQLFTEIDKGGGFGKVIIAGLSGIANALDLLATNAQTVGNILVGVLVAASVKTAVAALAAGAAARAQAADNMALAASAVAAARAQHSQAVASLAVARTSGAMSMGNASAAAANVTAAARALGEAQRNAALASTALGTATARAGLFGRALVAAASLGRAALAAIGGPIGLAIAGLVSIALYAGKAALSFQPIAGEAATVGDYVMEAFSQMGDWVSAKAAGIWKAMKEAFTGIMASARPMAVWLVDAFLSVARGVAGVVGGIVSAWREGFNQIGDMMVALKSDAQNIFTGNWGEVGAAARVTTGAAGSISSAFSGGYRGGASVFGGATGETVVQALEDLPGQIGDAIMSSGVVQGLRAGANERAAARARAEQGGAQEPGSPVAAAVGGADEAAASAAARKKTFEDILSIAQQEARIAGLISSEQEIQNALTSARTELERELVAGEEAQLTAAVRLRQQNAANLALEQATQAAVEETASLRLQAAAEEARMRGDFSGAASLEGEIRVQEMLNQAKREGVALDQAKVEAYRAAVTAAAQEAEVIRLQQEARRALQQIADNARKAMQSAVSDGIYAALSGDIKGVKGFFSAIGNILKRQIAESIAQRLFSGGETAAVDSARVTTEAISITVPAAEAVTAATGNIVSALNQGASSIATAANDNVAEPIAAASTTLTSTVDDLQAGTRGWVDTLTSALGPLGNVVGSFINMIGDLISGGGQAGGAAGRASALSGIAGKLGSGAQTGMIVAGLGKMISSKFSTTGSTIGGMAGSLVPIPGGKIIGSIVGGVIGGLFKKTPSGSLVLGQGTSAVSGNKQSVRDALEGTGDTFQGGIKRIADALGGQLGAFSVSIGKYKDEFRVSASGSSSAGSKKYAKKNGSDVIYKGESEEEAIRVAILNAIQDGAVKGIRQGTQRLLAAGKDLEAQMDKALAFEGVFRRLKQYNDPIGAAVEAVDREFSNLKDIFREAGASAAEYAQLEELYGKERAKAITEATKETTNVLSDFLSELRGGTLGGASVSDRVGEQNRLFSAIEAAQAAGQTVDYDQLNTVGRALIDATRELEGATPAFYDQVNRVMSVLESVIGSSGSTNISTLPSPLAFQEAVAVPVVGSITDLNGNIVSGLTSVVEAINSQTLAWLRANAANSLSAGGDREYSGNYYMAAF